MRERAGRDGNGNFVGIACDEESPVAQVGSPVEDQVGSPVQDQDAGGKDGDGASAPREEEVN